MSYIGNSPTSIAFLTDLFTGTGSLTTFTMSAAPASTSSILVSITGIVQEPSTYAVSGNTLTFSQAPPAGTGNVSVRYLGIPASNIVSTAYRTVTDFTATLAQTIFTVPSYTVGYITVYRNGARLGAADYTATSGTNVILTVAANTGDLVTTESFYVSSVLNAIPAVVGSVTSSYLLTGAVTSAKIANSVALVTPNIGVATATSLTTGALTATSIIGLTTPLSEAQGGTGTTSGYYGFKNRIINGGMVIDQRNAGASVTPDNAYTLDRWAYQNSQIGKASVQQNAGSVTPPSGFTNYLSVTSSSAYSVLAADYFFIHHKIEGFNFSDMGWGTVNAANITLSFKVYSSLIGTFGGSLRNGTATRTYPFSYSIPVANTWTTISITIAGDITGTWAGASNGTGVGILFSLGSGTSLSGTAGAWVTANLTSATGAVSVVGTSGATFYITGVQLEKGSVATSFDYRPYGTELSLCRRYFEKSFDIATAPAQNVGTAGSSAVTQSTAASLTSYGWNIPYKVTKRATPYTVTLYNPAQANAQAYNDIIGVACTATVVEGLSSTNFIVLQYASAVGSAVGQSNIIHWAANSEL